MSVYDDVRRAADPQVALLVRLIQCFSGYVSLPDYDALVFAAAVAATARMDKSDPTWGLLVGSSSSAKTEALRAFEAVADDMLDDVTVAGLLGWIPPKGKRAGRLDRPPGTPPRRNVAWR